MRSLIVPLAEMIPTVRARRGEHHAVEVPTAAGPLELLDDDALLREAKAAADAAVTTLGREDALTARIDFRRVRALVEREVQVSRGGPVHLTPLFLYLGAFSSSDVAARVVLSVGDALARLGLFVSLPAGPRHEDARRRRHAAPTTTVPRRAVGTRMTGLFAWA